MVHVDWALKSVSAEKWLAEEKYEANKFFPGAKKSRLGHGRISLPYPFPSPSPSILVSHGSLFILFLRKERKRTIPRDQVLCARKDRAPQS